MPKRKEHVVVCPRCDIRMRLKESRFGPFYSCTNWPRCDVTHGCHSDGTPFGTPGDKKTRSERHFTHKLFDKLWKEGHMSRDEAYRWMQKKMELTADEAHIGHFSVKQCYELMNHVEDYFGM